MQRAISIDQKKIDRYGKINGDNDIIHYDDAYAKERGFRGTLLHGPHMSGFAAEMGARKYGAEWLYRGRLHTKWVGPVCPGDVFDVRIDEDGVLTASVDEQVVLVGSATLR
ncbi:hypothetical protein ERD78_16540 [Allopusillimonas soli]|uniref:MaoC family dehydratase n=1 Tax=Allopusillimonas soli TaxID=659016 RepID=A0A853FF84_9BURK|nr:MaoC family dehydratase [Allopusillimonas soli]TEA71803.1 hypothetical protein ERD78_16540 [Allopusillimonas soli]